LALLVLKLFYKLRFQKQKQPKFGCFCGKSEMSLQFLQDHHLCSNDIPFVKKVKSNSMVF